MEIRPMLELTRIDFDNLSSKIMKVKCEDNMGMGEIKKQSLFELLEIKELLSEKIDGSKITNVDRLKGRINKLNDSTTQNINHLLDLNESLSNKDYVMKNKKNLRRARKCSQSIDNRVQKALRKFQKQ